MSEPARIQFRLRDVAWSFAYFAPACMTGAAFWSLKTGKYVEYRDVLSDSFLTFIAFCATAGFLIAGLRRLLHAGASERRQQAEQRESTDETPSAETVASEGLRPIRVFAMVGFMFAAMILFGFSGSIAQDVELAAELKKSSLSPVFAATFVGAAACFGAALGSVGGKAQLGAAICAGMGLMLFWLWTAIG